MKTVHKFARVAALLSCVMIAATAVHAHGENKHGAPAGPVKMVQKPWGIGAEAKAAQRTIAVSMSDKMRFTPALIELKLGETIRFVIKNEGKLMHEFVIGTKQELDAHAAMMLKHPDMAHEEPYMAHVPAGQTGEIVWTFNRAGEFDFACLIAGHYQAGMVGKLRVSGGKPMDGKSIKQESSHAEHKH